MLKQGDIIYVNDDLGACDLWSHVCGGDELSYVHRNFFDDYEMTETGVLASGTIGLVVALYMGKHQNDEAYVVTPTGSGWVYTNYIHRIDLRVTKKKFR